MSFIYFAREMPDGAIKIGTSDNPGQRIVELQIGNSRELQLLIAIRTRPSGASSKGALMRADERYWHERFKHLHVRGEWFRPEPELLACIRSLGGVATALGKTGDAPVAILGTRP